MEGVVGERGQVTIPKKIRDRLGIRAGQVLDFRDEDGRLIVSKVRTQSPADMVYGILQLPKPVDALIDEMRGAANLP
jgi:AbrB family looped-hinge helix DNA binding protein